MLLLKRANTGHLDGFWSVPAGRLDGGESITAGAVREAYEEVGVHSPQPEKTISEIESYMEGILNFMSDELDNSELIKYKKVL